MSDEIWKDVKGYEWLYWVSNTGKIKNRLKQRPLYKRKNGYMTICLCKNSKTKTHKVHRLVAEAFLENKENYKLVNHKNSQRDDNSVSNLEWCDYSHNLKHAYREGGRICAVKIYDDINYLTYLTILKQVGYIESREYMGSGGSVHKRIFHLSSLYGEMKIERRDIAKRKNKASFDYFIQHSRAYLAKYKLNDT